MLIAPIMSPDSTGSPGEASCSNNLSVADFGLKAAKKFADRPIMDEVRQIIQRRWVAIDNGEKRAGALGDDGKRRSRLNLQ